jgi:hypothetical protein
VEAVEPAVVGVAAFVGFAYGEHVGSPGHSSDEINIGLAPMNKNRHNPHKSFENTEHVADP